MVRKEILRAFLIFLPSFFFVKVYITICFFILFVCFSLSISIDIFLLILNLQLESILIVFIIINVECCPGSTRLIIIRKCNDKNSILYIIDQSGSTMKHSNMQVLYKAKYKPHMLIQPQAFDNMSFSSRNISLL